MIVDENGQLAGYVYVDTVTTDIGGYVEQAKRAIDEHLKLPAGYTLLWTGQYLGPTVHGTFAHVILPITTNAQLRRQVVRRVLRGLQKGRFDGGRNVDRDEAIS
jgi:hypothetical protein